MKKVIAYICILVLCLSIFAGCGKTKESEISLPEESASEESASQSVSESISNDDNAKTNVPDFNNPSPDSLPGYTNIVEYSEEKTDYPTEAEYTEWMQRYSEYLKERKAQLPKISGTSLNPQKEITYAGEWMTWMPTVDNETPLEILSATQVVTNYDAWYYESDCLHGAMTPYQTYMVFGSLTFMRCVDSEHYYTVYKVCGGGYLYVFFVCYLDGWAPMAIKCRYQPDIYYYEDLAALEIGDSIDRVIEIDSSVQKYKTDFDTYYCHTTIHLVKEGIFIIDYEKVNGEIVISDMELCEDGIYTRGIGDADNYEDTPIVMRLLPQDYPPAN